MLQHRSATHRVDINGGVKTGHSAAAPLDGMEVAQMIRKKQFGPEVSGFSQFAELAK